MVIFMDNLATIWRTSNQTDRQTNKPTNKGLGKIDAMVFSRATQSCTTPCYQIDQSEITLEFT
jgi:hypothetical protein